MVDHDDGGIGLNRLESKAKGLDPIDNGTEIRILHAVGPRGIVGSGKRLTACQMQSVCNSGCLRQRK